MKAKVWGCRGSVAAPGSENARYGGNTSCVQVLLEDGSTLVLDAGTGIRALGLALALPDAPPEIHILLTHLHLDHIQGLMFFAPCFQPQARIVIWGPAAPEASLEERISRYISAPLSPVEVRELPCDVSFRDCPGTEWQIGTARVRSASVTHRGPTLGYRITEGERSLCYLPDHEPAVGVPLDEVDGDWISGYDLARDATLLIHDCQYTDEEYPARTGWGHSRLTDALTFARRSAAERVLFFHHDPLHDDAMLDGMRDEALARWAAEGGDPERLAFATERLEVAVGAGANGAYPAPLPASGSTRA